MNIFKTSKKSLGQNFLIDQNIINKIIKIGNIEENKTVLEIGSGYGNLTRKIADMKPKKIYAIEKDVRLVLLLKNFFKDFKNTKIINNDIFNFLENKNLGQNIIVFGNLPYNISTQILVSLVLLEKWPPWYEILILMFQKEVADRIACKPGSKVYGITSVLLQAFYDIEYLFTVEPEVFDPPPKVRSAVIRLSRNQVKELDCDEKKFQQIVKMAFNQRRKTLRNSLKPLLNDTIKNETIFAERPEQLSVQQFIDLTNLIAPQH